MKDFKADSFSTIKSKLMGLPGFCRLVIYELLEYCDYQLGEIAICSLDEVAYRDFYVTPAPGRKKEAINGDTLRNALRTIKKAKSQDFRFSIKNQRIVIEMPFLRDLYEQFHSENQRVATEVVTDVAAVKNHISTAEDACFEKELAVEDAKDAAAASLRSVRDIKNNITNKLTAVGVNNTLNTKQLIQPNFYPTPETIAIALGRGFLNVTNHDEIQKFIKYNQTNESQWADFNPVFLCWLERDSEYQQTKQQQKLRTQNIIRSSNNERSPHKNNSYATAMEAVLNDNRNACAPSERYAAQLSEFDGTTYCLALDSASEHLRPTIHQQIR